MENNLQSILYTRVGETPEGTPGLMIRNVPIPFAIGTWLKVDIYDDHILITPTTSPLPYKSQ